MSLKQSSITADILNILSDGKIHTMNEIARKIEIHRNTVARHIQSLSYRYPIETFCGGTDNRKGGVYLDKNYIYQGLMLTNDELQVISQALAMLQNSKGIEVNKELVASLISRFTPPKSEEQVV